MTKAKKNSPLLEQAAMNLPKDVDFIDVMASVSKVTTVNGVIPYSVALKTDHADKYVLHIGVRNAEGAPIVWTSYRMDNKGGLKAVINGAA